ncbi:MAG: hypothetical protein WCB67_03435 [Solirubrobacteraceae bacterium]
MHFRSWAAISRIGLAIVGSALAVGASANAASASVVGGAQVPGSPFADWLVGSDGSIQSFDGAPLFGSAAGQRLNAPIVGMAATPDGKGYWLVGGDGGIFTFGDAGFHGSAATLRLAKPVVAMAATPDGQGYWLVGVTGASSISATPSTTARRPAGPCPPRSSAWPPPQMARDIGCSGPGVPSTPSVMPSRARPPLGRHRRPPSPPPGRW